MKLAYAGLTDVGLVRQNNEDNFLVFDLGAGVRHSPPPASCEGVAETRSPGGLLLAVADGMGGALAGEVASRMAVDALVEAARGVPPGETWEQTRNRFLSAISDANLRIHTAAQENPQHRGMGTTLTAAILRDGAIHFFQVGDSKGFLSRRSRLFQLTESHALLDILVRDKVISAEDAEKLEGGKNIILQALGAEAMVKISTNDSDLEEGDVLILCSDGLHGAVKQKEIESIAAEATDCGKLCEDLVRKAREYGAPDNVTVLALAVQESEVPPPMPGLMSRITGLLRKKK